MRECRTLIDAEFDKLEAELDNYIKAGKHLLTPFGYHLPLTVKGDCKLYAQYKLRVFTRFAEEYACVTPNYELLGIVLMNVDRKEHERVQHWKTVLTDVVTLDSRNYDSRVRSAGDIHIVFSECDEYVEDLDLSCTQVLTLEENGKVIRKVDIKQFTNLLADLLLTHEIKNRYELDVSEKSIILKLQEA